MYKYRALSKQRDFHLRFRRRKGVRGVEGCDQGGLSQIIGKFIDDSGPTASRNE